MAGSTATSDGAFSARVPCLDTPWGQGRFPFLWKSARHRLASAGVRGRPAKIKIRAPKRQRAATGHQHAWRPLKRQPVGARSCPPGAAHQPTTNPKQTKHHGRDRLRHGPAPGAGEAGGHRARRARPLPRKEPEEPAREPNRLERFEEWMATDWEFGPYYWEEGQERPESLKERCRQRFWWLYEKNLKGCGIRR